MMIVLFAVRTCVVEFL